MTESEFNQLVDDTFESLEDDLDELEIEIDYDTSGGILTVTFENNSKIILNRQVPLKQIWVAAKSGGYHFNYDSESGTWQKDDDATELYSALSQYFTEHAGQTVEFRHD